jgi:hypothetical protein
MMSRYDGAPANGRYRYGQQSYDVDRGGEGSDINRYTQEETPLDLQVGGQMSDMSDGYFEIESQPSGPTGAPDSENPWYDTNPKWQGSYKENSGEDNKGPQAPLPKAPSHQAILQQSPGWQPMEYAITREYSTEYVDVLNPRPVIAEEQDWGGTMISAEQKDYARAHREMMNMPDGPEETQDPYGNYDEIVGAEIHTPATGVYGMGYHEPNVLTPFERKAIINKLAVRYTKAVLPKLVASMRRRAMSGLGQAATTGAAAATAAATAVTPTFDIGKALADAISTIAPTAIGYATARVNAATNVPGGVQQLRIDVQQPPAAPPSEFPWGTVALVGGGVLAALFVLPKVFRKVMG